MKSQFGTAQADSRWLAWGEAVRLAGTGELRVEQGRVWLTREGDLDDHVLAAGDCMRLRAGDIAVVEPWLRGEPTRVAWRPAAQRRRAPDLALAETGAPAGVPCAG